MANQLAAQSYGYWGAAGGATPYYAGAVIVFLLRWALLLPNVVIHGGLLRLPHWRS